jgi:Spy/CpxP family protein refolding chaperone
MKRFSIAICLIVLAFAFLCGAETGFAQSGARRIIKNNRQQRRLEAVEGQRIPPRNQGVPGKFNRGNLGNPDVDNRPIFNPRIAALQKARPRLIMEALNLTPAQQARVREIRQTHDDEAIAVGRRLRQARTALDRALMGEIYNEVIIKEYTDELIAAQAEQIRINARMRAEIRKTLTPEQVRRFIEKDKEIQRQIRDLKIQEANEQFNRPLDQQQKPPDKDGMDLLDLFR